MDKLQMEDLTYRDITDPFRNIKSRDAFKHLL